jgi:S-methylmethionine-dependent homocysteine/selenocysteine methylase
MTTILDGGMGRELKRRGAPFRMPEWSALALTEGPEHVVAAHRAFVAAGADVITTNSYAIAAENLGLDRLRAEGRALADAAGRLAAEARRDADRPVRVAGSLGPQFGSYRPRGFDAAAAPERLARLVEGLAPHVDLWLAETMGSTAEAGAVATALAGDARPLWISYTLNEWLEPDGTPRLRSGETVAEATAAALDAGAAAVLFNCSPPEVMEAAVRAARPAVAAAGSGLGVYANAFADQDETGDGDSPLYDIRPDLTPEAYRAFADRWAGAGADILGGCCGVGPEHIAALARSLVRG